MFRLAVPEAFMGVPSRGRRSLTVGLAVVATLVLAWGSSRVGHGQGAPAPGRTSDLLKAAPFDRITLIDGTVLEVEPVSPRPLPPYDPSKEEKASLAKESSSKGKGKGKRGDRPGPPPEGNVFLPGQGPKDKKKDEPPPEIAIHWIGHDDSDFKVKRASIKGVEYFEDMLLAEGERLVLARDYDRAFEHYLAVKVRNPDWKGLRERVDKLLYEEGTATLLLENDRERGMRLLRELHDRRPDYPGLTDKMAAAYSARIDTAFSKGAYYQGRQVLHDLVTLAPSHDLARQWRERFAAKARGLVEKADDKKGAERLDFLVEAIRVWPTLEGLAPKYTEAFRALPTLDVGVTDVSRPFGPWVHSPADARVVRLAFLPILASADEEALAGKRPAQLAAAVEAADLGRRLILKLREGVAWSDGSRSVVAADVARAMADRAVSSSRSYQARWSELLDRAEVTDEAQLEIRLTRATLKPEDWLLGPVGPAHAAFDGLVPTSDGSRRPVGDGPFLYEKSGEDSITFVVNRSSSALGVPKIQRLREIRMADGPSAVGALIRGEVSLLERIPPDRVTVLGKVPGIKVGRYNQPSLHFLAIDGRSPILRNRTLRRGLSYAIDRRALLEESLLRRPGDSANAPADGPFPKGSYADAPDVKPLEYDPLLARMLVAAAHKEMGNAPMKLTFEYPAIPEAQAVAPKIIEALREAGLEIKEFERSPTELEASLRAGRRFDLAYRVGHCTEPVMEAGPLLCPGYDAPPSADGLAAIASPRTLQVLLQLERASEWPSARALATLLDRESRDELPILPLWQIEDHYAWRTRLKGPAESAERLYDSVQDWEIEPWYAKDPWSSSP
jgi:peptide/nickel transport system substrate-binding protein